MESVKANLMAMLSRAVTGWRDGLLDYVLQGTRQFEWCASVPATLIGGSAMLLFFPSDVIERFHLVLATSIAVTNILLLILGGLLMYALIVNDRQKRYDVSRWLGLTWIAKGAVWFVVHFGINYTWVTLDLFALWFFFICAVSYWHNSLALKKGDVDSS
jgi:hypothetical protein